MGEGGRAGGVGSGRDGLREATPNAFSARRSLVEGRPTAPLNITPGRLSLADEICRGDAGGVVARSAAG